MLDKNVKNIIHNSCADQPHRRAERRCQRSILPHGPFPPLEERCRRQDTRKQCEKDMKLRDSSATQMPWIRASGHVYRRLAVTLRRVREQSQP